MVLQRRQKATESKPSTSTSTTPTTTSPSPAPANSNVAVPPQVIAAQEEALAAELAGSAASAQALAFYRIPLFLLPIYQAAAVQYGVPWQILAAINEIETNYGTDLSVSTAGAVGWMQFMPATWIQYGVDAINAGYADPYNPVDAIFAAARYLRAAGAATDLHGAILAYNHSEEYVKSVLLRAKLISSYPKNVIATLTGLTDGTPAGLRQAGRVGRALDGAEPLGARLRLERHGGRHRRGQPARSQALGADGRGRRRRRAPRPRRRRRPPRRTAGKAAKHPPRAPAGRPDERPQRVGRGRAGRARRQARAARSKLGRYLILRDVYGDVFTYAGLGSIASHYPKPKTPKTPKLGASVGRLQRCRPPSGRSEADAAGHAPGTTRRSR